MIDDVIVGPNITQKVGSVSTITISVFFPFGSAENEQSLTALRHHRRSLECEPIIRPRHHEAIVILLTRHAHRRRTDRHHLCVSLLRESRKLTCRGPRVDHPLLVGRCEKARCVLIPRHGGEERPHPVR